MIELQRRLVRGTQVTEVMRPNAPVVAGGTYNWLTRRVFVRRAAGLLALGAVGVVKRPAWAGPDTPCFVRLDPCDGGEAASIDCSAVEGESIGSVHVAGDTCYTISSAPPSEAPVGQVVSLSGEVDSCSNSACQGPESETVVELGHCRTTFEIDYTCPRDQTSSGRWGSPRRVGTSECVAVSASQLAATPTWSFARCTTLDRNSDIPVKGGPGARRAVTYRVNVFGESCDSTAGESGCGASLLAAPPAPHRSAVGGGDVLR